MILSNIRNIDQSETFFVIILNLDQWIRCCVKGSIFSSGNYNAFFVQNSRTGWVALVESLTRNVIFSFLIFFIDNADFAIQILEFQ